MFYFVYEVNGNETILLGLRSYAAGVLRTLKVSALIDIISKYFNYFYRSLLSPILFFSL
jgi:hypothetical protein